MEEIANPFTFPPSQFRLYTKKNLVLLNLLRSRTRTQVHDPIPLEKQHDVLSDQGDLLDWDLTKIERPRADWIEEDGEYVVFGETWPIPNKIPSLEEFGVQQLYPKVPDHRPALKKLLRTILSSYHELVGALLIPPTHDPAVERPPEFLQHVEWLRLNATNMVAAINELRPIQARATLEATLVRQVTLRKEATKAIHTTCDELEAQLSALQNQAGSAQPPSQNPPDAGQNLASEKTALDSDLLYSLVSDAELEDWASQVSS